MTPKTVGWGILVISAAASFTVLFQPALTAPMSASDIVRPRTPIEDAGRKLYIANGCIACHTQYIRPSDMDAGAVRVSQSGDYIYDSPHLLGAHRTGPDLAQEGGMHPDDWNFAHFHNPRLVRPASIMPDFGFLSPNETKELIAFVQSLGGKMADARVARQRLWETQLVAAYATGEDNNAEFLHSHVPPQWMSLPNPYPPTQAELEKGKFVYQQQCINCHGPVGDGNGPAAQYLNPKPFNFTVLKRHHYSGGMLYYQIMNGITGSAMPFFKDDLESAKIWAVANYIAVAFVGKNIDSNAPDNGIDAAKEPVRIPGLTEPPYVGPIPMPFEGQIKVDRTVPCCPPGH